jgi:ADP-glucose pyrophosphorylase
VILPRNTLPALIACAKIKPDNLGGIFEELLKAGTRVECFTFTERWMDIGSFHSYLEAHRSLVGERALVDAAATVRDATMHGSVTVGAGCVIEQSSLTDCMVFDNVRISGCSLRSCVIDEGCVLEGIDLQKQMLRAGTKLVVS